MIPSQAPGLDELIQRLEAATGPSRELADEVLLACGWSVIEFGALDNPSYEWLAPDESTTYVGGDQPNPLASIDAALTLVPEGMYGFAFPWFYSKYSRYEKPCVFWRAAVHKPIWEKATPSLAGDDWFERYECNADIASPAIALTIAALKARTHNPPASNN